MKRLRVSAVAIVLTGMLGATTRAAGINTDVALPVPQGGFVLRTQVRLTGTGDDPGGKDREARTLAIPSVLVYGATAKTTLFGMLPYVSTSTTVADAGRRVTRHVDGLADFRLLARQTVFERDAVQRTSRIGLLAGLELPWGSEALSSHSTDFLAGGVYTMQTLRHEVDADLTWKWNREGRGVDTGDEYHADLAYTLCLWPRSWPEHGTPAQINAVVEANWTGTGRTERDGVALPDTGGAVLYASPGLQLVTKGMVYELSVQVPVVRHLRGDQVETGITASAGVRVQF